MNYSMRKYTRPTLGLIVFFSYLAPIEAASLNDSWLSNPGGWAGYSNFRDFTSQATGGAEALTADDVTANIQIDSIPSGYLWFPFGDLLLFESEKWQVNAGQTLQVAFSYDGLPCLECSCAGYRLSMERMVTTGDASITINTRIKPATIGRPDINLGVQSNKGSAQDRLIFPEFLYSITVDTEINLSGGASGMAFLQGFSQAFVVTPLPGSIFLFAPVILMGMFRFAPSQFRSKSDVKCNYKLPNI
jgi:hypothetical protein